ncbi:hypothetical protein FLBR109950_08545 [Flavobacterium branchiophilum]|uniref:Uncharacterized protein n=1 Tax=Flavobacterium branchiophilum (strain FL-15) TaxID=1034807 RepID=G2Z2Y9_FLABF|nr:hypothetical protein [Flavobacterium branchiophilum]CCB70321.1 Hypothetical protein FBFL15_2301 [Flavobacterium branchiophilum FL-15]
MENKRKFNKKLNIKVSPKILTNRELSDNEKLILSLDYTFYLKNGYTIYTNVDIGELLSLHQNIVGLCRKSLIKKGYLVKDEEDKRIHRLTDKLKSLELLIIEEKDEETKIYDIVCILPFEIYSNSKLKTGAKLLWGEYNTLSRTKEGYFKRRETTAKIMNVSVGSITNWTKQLFECDFLKLYAVNYGYYKNQKVVRTIEFSRKKEDFIDDFDDIFEEEQNNLNDNLEIKTKKGATKSISKKDDFKTEEEIKILPLEAVDTSQLYDVKQSKNNIPKEDDFIKKAEKKGGAIRFPDLPIAKKGKKEEEEDFNEEYDEDKDYDRDYNNSFDFDDCKE